MHLDEEQVQRAADGELGELAVAATQALRAHLGQCATCRARVSEAELDARGVNALLETLDVAVPPVTAASIARRAAAARRRFAWRRAAVLLLVAGSAAAAWAAPGSPVPRLVRQVLGTSERVRPTERKTPAAPVAAMVPGISVPAGSALRIEFPEGLRDASAVVSLIDGEEVQVRVTRGLATFSSGQDRLQITASGDSVRFEIGIPRAAPLVEVLVGARRVFVKQGDRLPSAARAQAGEPYTISLSSR
jgi:hypothetical protein